MKLISRTTLLLFGSLAVASTAAAQGGFNRAAMQKFRESHKYTFQLQTTVTRGLIECERMPSSTIKPVQAKRMLAVLNPLRSKPQLTQDQARNALQRLQRILDQRQLSAVDRAIQQSQSWGGGGGNGGGQGMGGNRGGGADRPRADRPRMDFNKMRNFNPFHPDKSSPRYDSQVDRNNRLFSFLQARAAHKPAKLQMPMRGPRR